MESERRRVSRRETRFEWSEEERDETKEIESEREAKDKFVHMLF